MRQLIYCSDDNHENIEVKPNVQILEYVGYIKIYCLKILSSVYKIAFESREKYLCPYEMSVK